MTTFSLVKSKDEMMAILRLQQENLKVALSDKQVYEEGYVTVKHTFSLISRMNRPYAHVVAKNIDEVIGYALVMTKDLESEIPVLVPMFQKINTLEHDDKMVSNLNYFVMGQICVAKAFRYKNIAIRLYNELINQMKNDFDYIITEVDNTNIPSMKMHTKVGFKLLYNYINDMVSWNILILKIQS